MVSRFQASRGLVVIVSGFQPHDRQYLSSLMLSTMMQGNFEHWLIETASYQTKMVKRILECLVIIVIQPGDSNSKVKFMEFLKHSDNKLLSSERYNMKLFSEISVIYISHIAIVEW